MATEREDETVVHGEVPVSSSISHAKQATVDDIVAEGDAIYKKVREANIDKEDLAKGDYAASDALLKRIQDEHKDFNSSLPLVVRWSVQTGQYHSDALRRYVTYIRGKQWDTRKDFIKDQGEYLVYVYKHCHPRYQPNEITAYRKSITDQLMAEDDDYEKIKKQAQAELERKNAEVDNARRRELYNILVKKKVAAETTSK